MISLACRKARADAHRCATLQLLLMHGPDTLTSLSRRSQPALDSRMHACTRAYSESFKTAFGKGRKSGQGQVNDTHALRCCLGCVWGSALQGAPKCQEMAPLSGVKTVLNFGGDQRSWLEFGSWLLPVLLLGRATLGAPGSTRDGRGTKAYQHSHQTQNLKMLLRPDQSLERGQFRHKSDTEGFPSAPTAKANQKSNYQEWKRETTTHGAVLTGHRVLCHASMAATGNTATLNMQLCYAAMSISIDGQEHDICADDLKRARPGTREPAIAHERYF